MTDKNEKYSVVIIQKQGDLTEDVEKFLADQNITQIYIVETETIITDFNTIRDSIVNLLFSIMQSSIYNISTGLTGNDKKLLKKFEKIKLLNKKERKIQLKKLDKFDKRIYKKWIYSGDWDIREEERDALIELVSEDIKKFFLQGYLSKVDNYDELIKIESRLMHAYSILVGGGGLEFYEMIQGVPFVHEAIGGFYYFFSDEEEEIDKQNPITIRIPIVDAGKNFPDFKYTDSRMHDFEGELLPYGVVMLEDLMRSTESVRTNSTLLN